MSKRIEPGDLCVVVREFPGFEVNLGAFLRVIELGPCPCGRCGRLAWSFQAASRPVCDSLMDDQPFTFCSSTAESHAEMRFGSDQLQPIKGVPLAEEDDRIVGLKHPLFGVELGVETA